MEVRSCAADAVVKVLDFGIANCVEPIADQELSETLMCKKVAEGGGFFAVARF